MITLFTLTSKSTVEEIACVLEEDGYSGSLARRVKRAFKNGTLVWTTLHIVITDGEKPSEFKPSYLSSVADEDYDRVYRGDQRWEEID